MYIKKKGVHWPLKQIQDNITTFKEESCKIY